MMGPPDETRDLKVEGTNATLSPVVLTEVSLPSQPGDTAGWGKEAAMLGILHSQKVQHHRQVACPHLWGGCKPELRRGVCGLSGLCDQDKVIPLRMSTCIGRESRWKHRHPGWWLHESLKQRQQQTALLTSAGARWGNVTTAGQIYAPPPGQDATWEFWLNKLIPSFHLLKILDEILDYR